MALASEAQKKAQKRYNHSIFGRESHHKCELKRKALVKEIRSK